MKDKELFAKRFQVFVQQNHKKRMNQEEAKEFFVKDGLDENQMQMILQYLEETAEHNVLTKEDEEYIEEYKESLSYLRAEGEGEKNHLYELVLQKNRTAKERLIELWLPNVIEIAVRLKKEGFLIEDLIQEGNVGLTIGIEKISSVEDADQEILDSIQAQICDMIEEEEASKKRDNQMIGRVDKLNQSLDKLEKELGRKVTVDELAVDMEISQDEVLDILKLAGEDIGEEDIKDE